MKRFLSLTLLFLSLFLIPMLSVMANTTNLNYGDGRYGDCTYGTCPITLSSSGSVSLNVTPTASGSCTVQKDDVSVLTDNTIGYTLKFTNSSTNTAMTSGSNSANASSGTQASPVTLVNNTWGYRIDGLAGFGAGPTSAQSNVSTPSLTFAGVPASNVTAHTLKATSGPANPAEVTSVWYGLCANTSLPNGTYTAQVIYTAVTN